MQSRFAHLQPAYARFTSPAPAGQAFDDFTSFYGSTTGSTTTTTTSDTTKTPTDSGAQDLSVYNAVGGMLSTTGATIANIVNSGNQLEIARLNNQAREQIAQLQLQAASAAASGNAALAAEREREASQLQQFQALLAARQQPANMALYIVGGLAALGVLAGIVYFATRPKHAAHSNPSMNRYEAILYPRPRRLGPRHGVSLGRFKTLANAESVARRVLRRHEGAETRYLRDTNGAWVDIYDLKRGGVSRESLVSTIEAHTRLLPSVGEVGYW